MAGLNINPAPAIVILGSGSLGTAQRIQQCYPLATIHGLRGRVEGADQYYAASGDTLRALYQQNTPIITLCAAGIVIRSLASLLDAKGAEPPVLAVAEDGSVVVPLLGGLSGVNVMARDLGDTLGEAAAITTSGELRFSTCLLNPPEGYALPDLEQGKRFASDLLTSERVRIEGDAPWLAQAQLPASDTGQRIIHVGCDAGVASRDELLIHPCSVVVASATGGSGLTEQVRSALVEADIAEASWACLLVAEQAMAEPAVQKAAAQLGVVLRFATMTGTLAEKAAEAAPGARLIERSGLVVALAQAPVVVAREGRKRGRLTVIGLGPGAAELMVPAVKAVPARAEEILSNETYVRMAGPFRND